LVLSFTLLTLFGIVQLATTAFYQVSADGATFVAAHDTVATYGDPTTSNASAAQSSGTTAFKRIVAGSISVLNPSSSTFETDVSQQVPGISALGNASALTVSSRLVEESTGSTSGQAASNCTIAATTILDGAIAGLPTGTVVPGVNPSSAPIGLISAGALITQTGTSAGFTLSGSPIVSKIGSTYTPIATQLANVTTDLTPVTSFLTALPLGLGTTIEAKLGPALSTIFSQALGGTFNAVSAQSTVSSTLNAVPGIGLLASPIESLLINATGGTNNGLLGSSGPLAAIAGAETALNAADAAATAAACTPAGG
jgi:hypothetical protein